MEREAGSQLAAPQRSPTPRPWRAMFSAWRGYAKKPTSEQHIPERKSNRKRCHLLVNFAKHKKGVSSAHYYRSKASDEASSSWYFSSSSKWTSRSSGLNPIFLNVTYQCDYIQLLCSWQTITDFAVARLAGKEHLTILELECCHVLSYLIVHFIKFCLGF